LDPKSANGFEKTPQMSSSPVMPLPKAIEKPHSTYTTLTVAIEPKDIIIMFRTDLPRDSPP
jgi:hypothetical protein